MGVWDWTTGELLARRSLRLLLGDALGSEGVEAGKRSIAVSGMWVVLGGRSREAQTLVVAVEGFSTVLFFDADSLRDEAAKPFCMDLEDDLLLDVASGENGEFVMSRYSPSVRAYTSLETERR